MTVKKTLSKIRGWFPQEPILKKTFQVQGARVKVDSETKQPPRIIPPEYKVSATKVAVALAVFWIIFYGFISFTFINIERYPLSAVPNCGLDNCWFSSWHNYKCDCY